MFTVLGEALLDMVQPGPGATYVARPGGGPFNIAVGLRRLGHPTRLWARLSRGGLSGIIRHHADRNDLDLTACVDTDDQTTLAFASLDATGRASYEFYVQGTADWGWTREELAALPPGTRVIHTGSLATSVLPGADVVLEQLERWYADGRTVTSFDPNIRPALAGPHDDAVRRTERFVAAAHVVKASDEDLAWLYPGDDVLERARGWVRLGARIVVVTRGAAGCLAVTRDGSVYERPGRPVRLVDTIGAGDAFASGLLSGLVDAGGTSPEALDALEDEAVGLALDRAILTSAMTCQRAGADPPTRTEYDVANLG